MKYGIGIICLILAAWKPVQTGSEELSELLISCVHPCFMGIEVDVTTAPEVFSSLGEEDWYDYGLSGSIEIWSWKPPEDVPFVDSTKRSVIFTFDSNQIVRNIWIALHDVDLATVIAAFGSPDEIVETLSSTGTDFGYDILYKAERLVFTVSTVSGLDTVTSVSLVSSETQGNLIDELSGLGVTQNCPNYGKPPCVAPTATLASPRRTF